MLNPTITLSSYSGYNLYFTCENFNPQDVQEFCDYKDFFGGFKRLDNDQYCFTTLENGSYKALQFERKTTIYHNAIEKFSPQSSETGFFKALYGWEGVFNDIKGTYKYAGYKALKEKEISPIGFVIGNNPEQYPTDGEKGGYWYELIGQITSTNALSLTDDVTNLVKDIAVQEIKQEVITNVD